MEKEIRSFEIRAVDGGRAFEGYAAKFGKLSEDLGGFREKIKRGAFSESIDGNPNIRALFDHDSKFVLGRTGNGTLELDENSVGLKMRVTPPATQWVDDTLILAKDKALADEVAANLAAARSPLEERKGFGALKTAFEPAAFAHIWVDADQLVRLIVEGEFGDHRKCRVGTGLQDARLAHAHRLE